MGGRRALLFMLLLLASAFGGCVGEPAGNDGRADDAAAPEWTPCEHPWPCADGTEWPTDLTGPFELREQEHVRFELPTGVTLDGAIWWPDVPEGIDVPVLLWATPYAGQCRYSQLDNTPDNVLDGDPLGGCDPDPGSQEDGFFQYLGTHGYAFAMFNVRGTGLSSGCYTMYGPESRADLAALVEALAALDGVNGRVGMLGISAMGGTPFMAAVEAPHALKAIMPSGIITDLWLNRFTPQGAIPTDYGTFGAGWPTFNSVVPPGGALTNVDVDRWSDAAQNAPERLCPAAADNALLSAQGQYTDDRDPAWWHARNMAPLLGDIEAAVLVQQGLFETGHAFQEDAIWPLIDAPKRMLIGPWGHDFNPDEELEDYAYGNSTEAIIIDWFDFWLKGLGDPPRPGIVDAKDRGNTWHEWDAWPPAAASELLYLTADGLSAQPGADTALVSLSDEDGDPCGDDADLADAAGTRVVYLSEPLNDEVLMAGNPFAYLEVSSDQPGGILAFDLYEVGPDGLCDETAFVAFGGADLRHHDGSGTGKDFPTGQATGVRIDFHSVADPIAAGNRLAIVLSADGENAFRGAPYSPNLQIGGSSHLVIPLVDGSIDGAAPTIDYPPRPRVPPETAGSQL